MTARLYAWLLSLQVPRCRGGCRAFVTVRGDFCGEECADGWSW